MKLFQLAFTLMLLETVACVAEGTEEPNESSSEPVRVEASDGKSSPQAIKNEMCACKDTKCAEAVETKCQSKL